MKKIALILLFTFLVSAVAFAEAPEDRIGELEGKVTAISSKAAIADFVAKVAGPIYIIIGLGLLFNRRAFERIMEDFCKNAALVFYGGFLALLFGLTIVLLHNVWLARWTVIITIIGWASLLKGIWLVAFPGSVESFVKAYQENKSLAGFHLSIALIFGIVLTFLGYFA